MKRLPLWLLFAAAAAGMLSACGGGGDGGGGTGSPWLRQIRGQTAGGVDGSEERGQGIAADPSGNVYVAGPTAGTLPGSPAANQGGYDLFLVKYSQAGDNLWTRQMGSPDNDVASAVAVDTAGNVYVAGSTAGTLPGSPAANQGGDDLFLVKFNAAGDVVWTRQAGTPSADTASAVAVDTAGNVYVAGSTAGTLPGSPAANEGNDDLFLVKFNAAGDVVWTRQMGSESFDAANALAVDASGSVYVAGTTTGTLPGSPETNRGFADPFLVKYNAAGDNVWTRQPGSPGYDRANGVSVDAAGNVYAAGTTGAILPGSPVTNRGGIDLFVVKFNGSGDRLWTQQKGTSGFDAANGIAVGASGAVYATGETNAGLDGSAKAGADPDLLILKYLPDGTGP